MRRARLFPRAMPRLAMPRVASRFCATPSHGTPWSMPPRNGTISKWLFGSAGVVSGIVVVGGITRLTESGLSIVDWKPVRGIVPPLTDAQWDEEFAKYKEFPEFQQKSDMTLDEFKVIFFWEWLHRVLARSMGVVYGAPLVYFASKGFFRGQPLLKAYLGLIMLMGAGQGALGWYMVKSGLDMKLLTEKQKATVSAYRLAAHLSLAFTIYASMVRVAFGLRMGPNPLLGAGGRTGVGLGIVRLFARVSFVSMFATAVTGAFTAGLDAGLLYNDSFPWMGEGLLPAGNELFQLTPAWKNITENPIGAQTAHRVMAGTTTWFIVGLNMLARQHAGSMTPAMRAALRGVNHALAAQVLLGFATIVSYVATPVAALHQGNSLVMLTMLIRLCAACSGRPIVL
jgi:cytochrome c oxidase assembly protein subunit 15